MYQIHDIMQLCPKGDCKQRARGCLSKQTARARCHRKKRLLPEASFRLHNVFWWLKKELEAKQIDGLVDCQLSAAITSKRKQQFLKARRCVNNSEAAFQIYISSELPLDQK